MLANTSLIMDPIWPFSLPDIGLWLLFLVATLLAALTIWTYLSVHAASSRRILAILLLRLGALLIACLLVIRPSFAWQKLEDILPSKLLIFVDSSESMLFKDEFDSRSRWNQARQLLNSDSVKGVLDQLAEEHKVEVIYYQGAEGVRNYSPDSEASGKRTDMGTWLHEILQKHGRDTKIRAMMLFSDGIDNGTRFPTLNKAVKLRSISRLHAIGLGKTTTSLKRRDIALTKIIVEPSPVPVKTKLTVKGIIDAPGFNNPDVNVELEIEGQEEKTIKRFTLERNRNNVIKLMTDAPITPGEVNVPLRVQPHPGETTEYNNQISTFLTVTKEGVSVLWVEGKKRAFEPIMAIGQSLRKDPRFRIYYTERLKEKNPVAAQKDWFQFDKQAYDVIVIGDISASRFSGGDKKIFEKISDLVQKKGAGLVMLGGYETFANSDWQTFGAEVAKLLPLKIGEKAQLNKPTRVQPTKEGKKHYLLRLNENEKQNDKIWQEIFSPLDGMVRMGDAKKEADVLAYGVQDSGKEPILVATNVGKGRVLAFGGDTTWKAWRRSPEALPAYESFWRKMMLWLAHQEDAKGNTYVKLDSRRISASGNQRLGFTVGMRGKGGVELENGKFTVQVTDPSGETVPVTVGKEDSGMRGYYWRTDRPGEYTDKVIGEAKDVDGNSIKDVATARFLAYAEDLERLRPAADHKYLQKLATAGGGEFMLADEVRIVELLNDLVKEDLTRSKPTGERWPDWNRNPASESIVDQLRTLRKSSALLNVLLLCSCLIVE